MSKVSSEYVEIKVDDGTSMQAWFARPAEQQAKRGLLVFQEAFGVNAHIRDVTERFAGLGFAAVAPELFHRSAPPKWEGRYDDFPSAMQQLQKLTEPGLENDVRSTYNWLKNRAEVGDAIACIGYCMGGRTSFLANSVVPLKAAISYYGGGIPALLGRTSKLQAPMLLFWGELDQHIPPEQRNQVTKAMRDANKQYVDVVFSNADHGFFCDARKSYEPGAARLAWDLTRSFLDARV
ncbi:MAG: dienelactone hydrolase family protein [Acidobacteria bacterium]|nr:MAG: dienelactone hydrolase family protein [Acidobacteriota bacterium]